MALAQKRFNVELRLTYLVEAESPDSALHSVLPMAGAATDVTYTVRESATKLMECEDFKGDPYAHLTKAAYKAPEVSKLLGVSLGTVYQQVKCIRIGSRRLYPRAAIIDVLENGIPEKEVVVQSRPRYFRQTKPVKPAKIIHPNGSNEYDGNGKRKRKSFTMKDAATMLQLSYNKTEELFDSKKIYYSESFGKKTLQKEAIEHYLNGGTPRQYVERLIKRAEDDGWSKDEPEIAAEVIRKFRAEWPESR